MRRKARLLLLAGALALGGCGESEPDTARVDDVDPWAEATYELEGGSTSLPPAKDDGEALARRILMLDGSFDDHGISMAHTGRHWGKDALPAAPYLRDHLLHEADGEHELAAHALAGIGKDGLPFLRAAIESKHADAREAVFSALREMGTGAAPLLAITLSHIADPSFEVGCEASLAVAAMGVQTPSVEEYLRQALLSPQPGLDHSKEATADRRRVVCFAMDELGFRAPASLDAYEHVARDEAEDAGLRLTAFLLFLRRSPEQSAHVSLAHAIRHEPLLRDAAIELLVQAGSDEPDVIEAFVNAHTGRHAKRLRDKSRTLYEMLVATGPNGQAAAIPLAVQVLDWGRSADEKVRAANALGQTGAPGRKHPHVREALEVHADPDNSSVRVAAASRAALIALGIESK